MAIFGRRGSARDPEFDNYDADSYDQYGDDYDTDDYRRVEYKDGTVGYQYAYRDDQGYDAYYDGPEYQEYEDFGYEESGYDQDGYDEPFDDDAGIEPRSGPYDYDDVAELLDGVADQRLDLGSVIIPVPQGGQLQVEMTQEGTPQAVHLATQHGRITVAAYAAPKSAGQWRTVAADLAESLRKDGSRVSVQTGPWGRELFAVTEGADLRFIGVDGYRWMLRLVAAGPAGSADEGSPLVAAARAVMSETVVRRGTDALPVREPLPVVLPQQLAEQLAAAHQQQVEVHEQQVAAQQQVAAAKAAARTAPRQVSADAVLPPAAPQQPRRGADGSAMQQLGRN